MHPVYLERIKSFEGFTPLAKPDYAQHSNGFGTKALYPGEKIDRAEAEIRFKHEIARAREFVERHAHSLDEGTKAALTSLTFNAGRRWASSGLGDAARQGDLDAVRERFVQYTKAGGSDLPGLVTRRLAEVTWIGNGGVSGSPADARLARLSLSRPSGSSISAETKQPGAPRDSIASFRTADTQPPHPSEMPITQGWPAAQASPVTAFALTIAALELTTPRTRDDRNADRRATRGA